MAKRKSTTTTTTTAGLDIKPMKITEMGICILSASPMIFNRQSGKAQRELLFPAPPKNRASKRANLKHDPLQEYRNSVYRDRDDSADTRLVFPANAFKGAAMTAALEIPGATKASIGRLLVVCGYQVRIWGVPRLFMAGIRQAGMNKTPDIRTRAILPEWATIITVQYPEDTMNATSVANLFAAAGQVCGIGDWRQEKGKGSFGLFSLVSENNADFQRILAEGGREAQDAALENPEAFDQESADLWSWFEEEVVARGREKDLNREHEEMSLNA
jgi:hypothetical protein